MPHALVVSVGTGTRKDVDISRPLVKLVRQIDPDFVAFLVSAESERVAHTVVAETGIPTDSWQVLQVPDVDDIEEAFRVALAAIRTARDRGYALHQISIDFTSGTKAMSAGIAMAGVIAGCGSLRYIAGTRQQGIVMDGTERFLSLHPTAIIAYREIELARALLLRLQFRGAIERCEAVNSALLDDHGQAVLRSLDHLAHAYDAWDKFDHRRFRGEYGEADMTLRELASFRLADGIPRRVLAIAEAIKAGQLTDDLLADLYANAERRRWEGRFDDAVARLYRLVEMLAQRELGKYGLETGDLDLAKLPTDLAEAYAKQRDPSDGKVKIGLRDAYHVLKGLDSPLASAFDAAAKLGDDLAARNRSILAHGITPIDAGTAKRLSESVLVLARSAIPGFEERCRQLQFPWLVDDLHHRDSGGR
jgi:CRISPR-associated protein (TIGR02710 family)